MEIPESFIKQLQLLMVDCIQWTIDNGWTLVHSKELGKSAYVNAHDHAIYIHGSDYHYTALIKQFGKSPEEIYEMFAADRKLPVVEIPKYCIHEFYDPKYCKSENKCKLCIK